MFAQAYINVIFQSDEIWNETPGYGTTWNDL